MNERNANEPIRTCRVARKGGLDIRDGAGIWARLLGTLRNGTEVELTSELGNGSPWVKVRSGNMEGYVRREFLR